MPWFPEFTSAVELARRQTRAAGVADPVALYFTALNRGDTHLLETVWPGEVVIYDPRAAIAANGPSMDGAISDRPFCSQATSTLVTLSAATRPPSTAVMPKRS
jgi:hypothetical protein